MSMLGTKRRIEPVPAFQQTFEQVRAKLPGAGDTAIAGLRSRSIDRFVAAGFPTTKVEAWRYSNIAPLANQAVAPAPPVALGLEQVRAHCLGGTQARRMIFVNGHLQGQWSHVHGLPDGVIVMSLQRAIETRPAEVAAVLERLDDERALSHLNTAFAGPGAWIEVGPGVEVEAPLQLLLLSAGQAEPSMTNLRCVIRLGEGASLRLIESHVGLAEGQGLTNLVIQLDMGARSRLRHDRLQFMADGMSLVSKLDGRIGGGASYAQTIAALGGVMLRNESEVRLVEPGAECLLNGIAMPRGAEQVDHMIRMHHMAPGCHSDQFYKNVVDDHGRAAFAGKVIVHQNAQQTNAYQKNDSLLLSDHAQVDAKPELEIYADDVKCSHGATCGDIDGDALFYLRSRGLSESHARSLLTYAFAAEIVGRFADATVSLAAKQAILARQPDGGALGELL